MLLTNTPRPTPAPPETLPEGMLDIAGGDLGRPQRAEHAALGVLPEGPHAQALGNAVAVGGQAQVEAGPGDLAAGEHLVTCLEPAAARPVR